MSATHEPPVGEPGPCVLVVDDDPRILDLMEDLLSGRGYRVIRATSSGDAAAALAAGPLPRAALIDLVLPGWDGVDIMQWLAPKLPPAAVILMTGYHEHPRLAVARQLGVRTILLKPFAFPHVLDAVGAICN